MSVTFNFTSRELQSVIEIAIEKAVNKLQKTTPVVKKKAGKKFLKIKEFAEEFNVTTATVHKYGILERKIYAEKLDGTRLWRIPVKEIMLTCEIFKISKRGTIKKIRRLLSNYIYWSKLLKVLGDFQYQRYQYQRYIKSKGGV